MRAWQELCALAGNNNTNECNNIQYYSQVTGNNHNINSHILAIGI